MSKDYENDAKYVTLISRIRVLSKEGQKKVIKSILYGDFASEYMNKGLDEKKHSNGIAYTEEEIEGLKEKRTAKANKAVDLLFDILYGEDEELRFRILDEFVDDFEYDVSMIKGEICNHNHDYSEWKKVKISRPVFDKNGDIEIYDHNIYFERKCNYCGLVQKAYSIGHKERIEEEEKNWAEKHPKKLINTPKNKNTEN